GMPGEPEKTENPEDTETLPLSMRRRPVFRTNRNARAIEVDLKAEKEAAPKPISKDGAELVADLTENGTQFILCSGGRGVLANRNFATARRQTPRFAQPGET